MKECGLGFRREEDIPYHLIKKEMIAGFIASRDDIKRDMVPKSYVILWTMGCGYDQVC